VADPSEKPVPQTTSVFPLINVTSIYDKHLNEPPKANSAFHPSGVGKPASARKAKAGVVYYVSG